MLRLKHHMWTTCTLYLHYSDINVIAKQSLAVKRNVILIYICIAYIFTFFLFSKKNRNMV
jgi:hypothetical protein